MTAKLNRAFVKGYKSPEENLAVPIPDWDQLPERVLQFGTGVLLRGLPDYFIDKANRQGIFNGRIVVVKSTDKGGVDKFVRQDGLYTVHVNGLQGGKEVQESILVSAISRVLSAAGQWQDILDVALNPAITVVISNTTEVGIVWEEGDDPAASPPASFPAKLTALLYRRFQHFGGDSSKGWVILPAELISDNGAKLKEIVVKLARIHGLGEDFVSWLEEANDFCNTLVDRIVPGRLPADQAEEAAARLGYTDDLAIMAEPFRLWAIESGSERVRDRLSFAQVDDGMVIASDIWKFKELKLRLLNGCHTFSCGLAVLSGFTTVKEAMRHDGFLHYVRMLMEQEIVSAIVGEKITVEEAINFAANVIDRFSNPFLNHQWLSISLNYTSKMQMRNAALLENYVQQQQTPPPYMALGFAAYLRFMCCKRSVDGSYRGNTGNDFYIINDEHAAGFASLWEKHDPKTLVDIVLKNRSLWKTDLSRLAGFAAMVKQYLQLLLSHKTLEVMKQLKNEHHRQPVNKH